MWTTTGVVSLAVPVKDGALLFDGDVGWLSVTVGDAVLTMNVTAALLPSGFPRELGCVANAVYSPLGSSGLAASDVQLPLVGVAVALDRGEPVAVAPL